jgi:hypothetical protein
MTQEQQELTSKQHCKYTKGEFEDNCDGKNAVGITYCLSCLIMSQCFLISLSFYIIESLSQYLTRTTIQHRDKDSTSKIRGRRSFF